ncbi:MAG: hypothetical protein U0P46_04795 [Holophagaceae bacterium]
MRSQLLQSIPILAALLAIGCGTPKLIYEVDPAFRSRSYATVAADPRKDRILLREGARPLSPELHTRAVLVELGARRYQTAPAEEADLWVAAFVLTSGHGERGGGHGGGKGAARSAGGEGRHGGGRGRPEGGGEESGGRGGGLIVIVQVQDRRSGLTVWQGEMNLDPHEKGLDGRPPSIEAAVRELLGPFPPRP